MMYSSGWMALIIAAMLLTASCSKKGQEPVPREDAGPVISGTRMETVKTATIPETFEVVGTVRARTSAVVSPRVPGTITILRVREGERVKKGQLLAQLEAAESVATAAVATAGIDEARRGVEEAGTRKKLAEVTFERFQRLFHEQAISKQEFDVKQTEKELAAQGAARAEARLKQALESSRAAGTMAGYTRIVAPISGIITSKTAGLGATVFPAQPLMTIEDEGSYQLDLAVPESMSARIQPGSAVQVALDTVPGSFTATIAEVVPATDPLSRTFSARINLNRKGLRSGMFGRGTLSLGTSGNGLLVPQKALFERGSLTSVWVVGADQKAHLRLVKPGKTIGNRVEILAGLTDGERIVTEGLEKISEGARLQ